MKKQILLLCMAFFASITVALAQPPSAVPGSAPRPLVGCADDALHPIAGKPYIYKASATPTGGEYYWWATKNVDFITTTPEGVTTNNLSSHLLSPTTVTAGTDLSSTSANYAIAGTSDEVTIVWSSTILANTVFNTNPTFVAVYYQAGGTDCADNFKVYQLDPKNGFTVDIRNVAAATKLPLAFDATDSQCIDDVRGATFSGTGMLYNYGTNYLIYEVIAANFSETWTPQFEVTGLHAVQTATVQWTYALPSTWDASTVFNAASTPVLTSVTNTSTGVSIYVRVTVTNNNYEGIAARDITLAVAGRNKEGLWDVNNVDCTQPTTFDLAKLDDTAVQRLLPRPTVPSTTTSPITPNIELVPGNNQN